ncbi:MAG: hypothetical protein AAGH79_03965 [Bacteroidota bacterium]
MAQPRSTYRSRIYRDFKGIDPTAYQTIIRFFEDREEQIRQLDEPEFFELLVCYTDALFQIGAWGKHILVADEVIEYSILHFSVDWKENDIYYLTLFQKAKSLFKRLEFGKAEYILRELLGINPEDTYVENMLRRSIYKSTPAWIRRSRAISISLFLLAAVITSAELLVIRPFYDQITGQVEAFRIGIFLTGMIVLVGSDILQRIQIYREVKSYIDSVKDRKPNAL